MNDDDLIRRALGAGRHVEPISANADGAIERGIRRRRQRISGAAGLAAVIVLVAGVAVAGGNDRDDAIVSVSPSTELPITTELAAPTSTTTASTPTSAPPTTSLPPVATSIVDTTSTAPSTPTSTTSPTSPTSTTTTADVPAPTTTEPVEPEPTTTVSEIPECPQSTWPSAELVDVTTDGAPAGDDAFFVARPSAETDVHELWTPEQRWATIDFRVYDGWYQCFDDLRVVEYDGRWVWVSIAAASTCACSDKSMLIRVDLTTGARQTMWTSLVSERVLDVQPRGDGGALLLAGPAAGFIGLYDVDATPGSSNGVIVDAWPARGTLMQLGQISPDASRVALVHGAGFSDSEPLELRVAPVDSLGIEPNNDAVMTPPTWTVTTLAWSPDGTSLLLHDFWETADAVRVDAVDLTWKRVGTHACDLPDGSTVVADWGYGYDGEPPVVGDLSHHSPAGATILADDVDGTNLVCLPSGRVLWATWDSTTSAVQQWVSDLSGHATRLELGTGDGNDVNARPQVFRW